MAPQARMDEGHAPHLQNMDYNLDSLDLRRSAYFMLSRVKEHCCQYNEMLFMSPFEGCIFRGFVASPPETQILSPRVCHRAVVIFDHFISDHIRRIQSALLHRHEYISTNMSLWSVTMMGR
jgi:hypothetical protein